jgi:glucose/arabinose dehydrogenase
MPAARLPSITLLVATLVCSLPAQAQTLTKTLVAGGLPEVTYVTSPPDDASRLFAVRRNGRIRIIENGTVLPTSFLNIGVGGGNLVSTGGEQGLLSMAFHPKYAQNGWFYVCYTDQQDAVVVVRYTVSADPYVADPTSAAVVLGPVPKLQTNHNGGCLQFGPDGKLYFGLGDGGGSMDQGAGHAPGGNAQSPQTLLGKLLRLDVDLPFPHVPTDNPFVGDPSTLDEIWHLGLRNPWRFSFDRATGELYIADVGDGDREEIDVQPTGLAALNFGWVCKEGSLSTLFGGPDCPSLTLTDPIHEYVHAPGSNAVVGGYVYRGCAIPELYGTYLFGDVHGGRVWSFRYVGGLVSEFVDRTAELAVGGLLSSIASFGEDAAGELYLCDWIAGEVYRIDAVDPPVDCNANGLSDACDVAQGTSPDLDRNGVPDECECATLPATYCTAKTNSLGCTPAIDHTGTPKLGAGTPFVVRCEQVLNHSVGLLLYGSSPAQTLVQGGFLCVASPFTRTSGQVSGGSAGSGSDCSGSFAFDFSAYVASGADPVLVAGAQVDVQYWSRDPADPTGFGSSLSDALEFLLCN